MVRGEGTAQMNTDVMELACGEVVIWYAKLSIAMYLTEATGIVILFFAAELC